MYANLDFKVSGSVDFTMDLAYTGGFSTSTSCGWHEASSPYSSYSCNTYSTPSEPSSITNMASVTDMKYMFDYADSFDVQNICGWDLTDVITTSIHEDIDDCPEPIDLFITTWDIPEDDKTLSFNVGTG